MINKSLRPSVIVKVYCFLHFTWAIHTQRYLFPPLLSSTNIFPLIKYNNNNFWEESEDNNNHFLPLSPASLTMGVCSAIFCYFLLHLVSCHIPPSIFSSCEFSQNDFYNHYAHSCMHVCAHRFSKCRFRMCIAKIVEYVLVVCRPLLSDQRIVLWIKAITVSTTVLNHRSLFIYFTIFYPYSLIYLNCFVSLGYQGLCFQQNVGYWFSYGYIRGYFDATSSIPSSGE